MVTLLLENGAPLSYKHNGTKVKFLKECETDSIRELLLKAHEEVRAWAICCAHP